MVRPDMQGDARLLRFAELAHRRQFRPFALGLGVDHQPVLVEAEILVGNVERLADEAVAAVGPDQVAALNCPLATVAFDFDFDPL